MTARETKLIGLIALAAVAVAGLVYFDAKQNLPQQVYTHEEKELGVSFSYPESWGEVVVNVSASPTYLKKEIMFDKQKDIKLRVDSSFPIEEIAVLQGGRLLDDPYQFCKTNLTGDREDPFMENTDIFRVNGEDQSGFCKQEGKNTDVVVHAVNKVTDQGTPEQITSFSTKAELLKNTGSSTINFQKIYYLKLKNPVYGLLSITVSSIPLKKSDKFCVTTFDGYGTKKLEYWKDYQCLSHGEREIIESGFRDFETSELNKEIEAWINDIKINTVIDPRSLAGVNFSDLGTYKDTTFHFQFDYPKVFQLKPQFEGKKIWIDNFKLLRISSREDIVEEENNFRNCEGPCSAPMVNLAVWDYEKSILDSNPPVGPIKCEISLEKNSVCEIKSLGGKKVLLRYTGVFGGESAIIKTYILYNEGLRFEINSQPLYGVGTDPRKYQEVESAFVQGIIESIVESLRFQ